MNDEDLDTDSNQDQASEQLRIKMIFPSETSANQSAGNGKDKRSHTNSHQWKEERQHRIEARHTE